MSRKLRVLLVQLPVPNNPTLNTPLAAGYLKAYAHAQGLLDHVEIEILPRPLADHAGDALLVDEIAARRPDVLGVSLYTWNSERSLEIARRVKQCLPDLLVIVGGPEVQRDNAWVLNHPAVDIAVLGEGEQTFADLLRYFIGVRGQGLGVGDHGLLRALHPASHIPHPASLAAIPGIAFRDSVGTLIFTVDRPALPDLAVVPSPYLLDYLDVPADGMLMVEVSRWCPYRCSFCLYGRNMGPKLGNRYFDLQRVLQEIAWGKARGVRKVHFVEANLNLVPLFWRLMHALADLNADRQMTFYAELRGEHLTDEVVAALDRANVRYVEVGLQTANPVALHASQRRTNLSKWAAGTRRLYRHTIEVYLDVIVGLPTDDAAGMAETVDFIRREDLGPYDIFTLQVLPGTAVRQQAGQYGLRFQDRPPYYVLATDRLSYADLRRLRRELKQHAGLSPDMIEGVPPLRATALARRECLGSRPVDHVWLDESDALHAATQLLRQLANHVDLVLPVEDLQASTPMLAQWIEQNPSTIFDVYLQCNGDVPDVDHLRRWRDQLPHQPGYLDRVAVYGNDKPEPQHRRVSPRLLLVLPWTATVDPDDYRGVAEIIWRFELIDGDVPPFGAWRAAGGAGIALHFAPDCTPEYRASVLAEINAWQRETGCIVWLIETEDHARVADVSVYSGRI